jgi:cbb3-type cytochrome oxidase maturation protein
MSVIFFLIAIGILVAGGFLIAFIWSVRSGQYDDDYTPSVRMLFDHHKPDDSAAPNGAESADEDQSSDEDNEQSEQSINHKT